MKDLKQQLEALEKQLEDQRRQHAERLRRLDDEIEETKRRISAARLRIHLLQRGELPHWDAVRLRLEEEAAAAAELEEAAHADQPLQTLSHLPPKKTIGEQLLEAGLITEDQLMAAIERQQQYGGRLGDILMELGFITAEQLRPFVSRPAVKPRLGEMLVRDGYITQSQLDKALAFQKQSGGKLGDILLSLRFIEPEKLYRAIATQYRIGRIGNYVNLQPQQKLPESLSRKWGAVIIHQYPNRFLVAVNEPLSDEARMELEQYLDFPVEQVLATNEEMEMFRSQIYGEEMLEESTKKLAEEQPENSASRTFTRQQLLSLVVVALFVMYCFFQAPMATVVALNIMIQVFYFLMTFLKFVIIMYGSRTGAQYRFTDEDVQNLDERELPIYTILVPMYKESEVIPQLLVNLEKLDYPKAKLDVRLLIEEDDKEAQEMLKHMRLPPYYTTIVVPDSKPKTKPKACNFGLIHARGEYVVIYDAEDRPDPDQLKKVILTFKACSDKTVCVQAKLNYFNSEQNLLTRWFTQEYSMWFELLLPGIMRLDIPIPLGGTSNHFKTSILKELNAWDPYNVTEDADLGIRLYKAGYKTAIVDSRTWEEANSRFGNWIRQRSRWFKGYMQTWLVHMRHPLKLWKEIGTRGFLGFQVMVLATPVIPLLNPIFWLLMVLWYIWELGFIPQLFPGMIYYIAAVELYLGNFFFIYANIAGVYWVINDMERKKQNYVSHRLVKYALLTPLYWMMMSLASYKALWQLVTKPFYWEKTIHGLDNKSQPARPA
jgi:cellulose synthase/poly-beta-1,6-N-acetylglucosamine synthase-like glycosyltransferase